MDASSVTEPAAKLLSLDWTSAAVIIGALFIMIAALIGWTQWQASKRETRLTKERENTAKLAQEREDKCVDRVRKLEDEMRIHLATDAALNREAIKNCTDMMDNLKDTNEKVVSRLCDLLDRKLV